jgi:hypothetical protein
MDKTIFTVALIGVAGLVAYSLFKRNAVATATSSTTLSNSIARGADTVARTSGNYLDRAGMAGRMVDTALNRPITNVTSGDWRAAAGSALTGGGSDFIKKLNPLTWF